MLNDKDEKKETLSDEELHAIATCPLGEGRATSAMMRKARDEPIPLAEEEALFKEKYFQRIRGKGCEEILKTKMLLTQREDLMLTITNMKSSLNGTKVLYKEELTNQWEEWKKIKKEICQIEEKEWFRSLKPEQKKACIAEQWKQAFLLLSMQNGILEKWGDDIKTLSLLLNTDNIYKKPVD